MERECVIMVVVESSGRGVEEVQEGRRGVCVFVCNVMKERTRQGEVGAGREEGGEGVKERGAVRGGGRVGERQREVKEVGGGRGARQEGRKGGREG